MAIAGIKPLNQVKTKYIHPAHGEPIVVNDLAAGEYWGREKVRDILIKFGVANDIDHIAATENMTLNELVDEFMESDGEE